MFIRLIIVTIQHLHLIIAFKKIAIIVLMLWTEFL